MAKEKVSMKQKWTCDGCGLVKEYEVITPAQSELQDILSWITLVKGVLIGGQPVTLQLDAHSKECVSKCCDKFDQIEIDENRRVLEATRASEGKIDEIDLNSLRVSSGELKN